MIEHHGFHLLVESDLVPGGPAHCTSTGPHAGGAGGPEWLDCTGNFMFVITSNMESFVELG